MPCSMPEVSLSGLSESPIHTERKKKRSRTNWLLLSVNAGVILLLLLSYLAAHVRPETLGYFSLFGLLFPFNLLLNIGFVIYWSIKKWKFALFSATAILVGIGHVSDLVQINLGTPDTEHVRRMTVLTYNAHNFGVNDWKTAKTTRNAIFQMLDSVSADVVCFQEFFHSDKKNYFVTRDSLVKFLPSKYYHERYTHAMRGQNYFGVAIFSKYPILKKGFVPFENDVNNFCIYVDVKAEGDTVRIYNAHLQSIRFKPEDYAFVDQNRNQEELESGSKRIARRLKTAMIKRQKQVERVVASIKESPYPVVLCGDFNDPPCSYTYEQFTDVLEDSFHEAGLGIGNTYIGIFPSFRIDYILHSERMDAVSYHTLDSRLSDHHPVEVVLAY